MSSCEVKVLFQVAGLLNFLPLPGRGCVFSAWLYITCSMAAVAYSCAIALNSQLIFVFDKRPPKGILKYYLFVPITVVLAISMDSIITNG